MRLREMLSGYEEAEEMARNGKGGDDGADMEEETEAEDEGVGWSSTWLWEVIEGSPRCRLRSDVEWRHTGVIYGDGMCTVTMRRRLL